MLITIKESQGWCCYPEESWGWSCNSEESWGCSRNSEESWGWGRNSEESHSLISKPAPQGLWIDDRGYWWDNFFKYWTFWTIKCQIKGILQCKNKLYFSN